MYVCQAEDFLVIQPVGRQETRFFNSGYGVVGSMRALGA